MTILHWTGEFLRMQLEQIPLSVARWFFKGLYLALIFWVIQIPSSKASPAGGHSKWNQDLKIWAWAALLCQLVIYSVF